MSWIAIIEIIIQIITYIMALFDPAETMGPKHTHYLTDYDCDEIVWVQEPTVTFGELSGVVQGVCEFKGLSGQGLSNLRGRMLSQVQAEAVSYAGPFRTVNGNGVASVAYNVNLDLRADGQPVAVSGRTELAMASAQRLTHRFTSTSIQSSYLTQGDADIEVSETNDSDWYRVRATQNIKIRKPWYIGSGQFKKMVVEEVEAQLPGKIIESLNEMALHL